MDMNINTAELLEHLKKAAAQDDGVRVGATKQELIDQLGWSKYMVEKMLKQLAKSGRVKGVLAPRPNILGVYQPTPVYVLTDGEETDNM